jgi:hypothetical protein
MREPSGKLWEDDFHFNMAPTSTSASFPKFVIRGVNLLHELRKQSGTSKHLILVPLFDLKFLSRFAATGAGTSNRRH